MTDLLLPAAARARLGQHGQVVTCRRSRVLHVAHPAPRDITRTGRLRKGTGPVCGTRGYPWRLAPVDGRALCLRCARTVEHTTSPSPSSFRRHITEADLRITIETAQTVPVLEAATTLLCHAPVGVLARLSSTVRTQRLRLGLEQQTVPVLPRRESRRSLTKPAWAVTE